MKKFSWIILLSLMVSCQSNINKKVVFRDNFTKDEQNILRISDSIINLSSI
jgi:hypothetical protein